jgi:DNA-binding NtrC family response regulator
LERNILIVDDGPEIVHLFEFQLRKQGYTVFSVDNGKQAIERVRAGFRGLIILDLVLPDFQDLELFDALRNLEPTNRIVIVTAHGTFDLVAQAIRRGAFDFLSKSQDILERLFVVTKNAFESWELNNRVAELSRELGERREMRNIVARSPAMQEVQRRLHQVMSTKVTVLLQGESGTGKEVFARALHAASSRADAPFVAINCAGIPESLLESELFGYEKGAFTGANARKIGRFEAAHTGTVFLDEIGEMAINLQAKLLRVLQEREFERIGGSEKVKVDVRVISATNRELMSEVEAGKFRLDLYYRLAVFTLNIPPLRERAGDVRLLAHHFAERFAREEQRRAPRISDEAMRILEAYPFPGNVRELENIINHACVVCSDSLIRPDDLPPNVLDTARAERADPFEGADVNQLMQHWLESPRQVPTLEQLERALIRRAHGLYGGNVTEMAKALGLGRATLYRRLSEMKLVRN